MNHLKGANNFNLGRVVSSLFWRTASHCFSEHTNSASLMSLSIQNWQSSIQLSWCLWFCTYFTLHVELWFRESNVSFTMDAPSFLVSFHYMMCFWCSCDGCKLSLWLGLQGMNQFYHLLLSNCTNSRGWSCYLLFLQLLFVCLKDTLFNFDLASLTVQEPHLFSFKTHVFGPYDDLVLLDNDSVC